MNWLIKVVRHCEGCRRRVLFGKGGARSSELDEFKTRCTHNFCSIRRQSIHSGGKVSKGNESPTNKDERLHILVI